MKKLISLKVDKRLLDTLDELKRITRIPRNALIEQGIELILQLYRQPQNEDEIVKTAKQLLEQRKELYERLSKK